MNGRGTSWDEAFANRYDEWSAHMTADIAFYVALARKADGPLVELAIGNGRVAIPVAQATGRRVIGIDSSPAMLEQARRRAADSPGTLLPSTTGWLRVSTGFIRRSRCRTAFAMRWVTTGSI